jgi:hypothetical protein
MSMNFMHATEHIVICPASRSWAVSESPLYSAGYDLLVRRGKPIAVTFVFTIALSIAFTTAAMIAVAILTPAIATGIPAAAPTTNKHGTIHYSSLQR